VTPFGRADCPSSGDERLDSGVTSLLRNFKLADYMQVKGANLENGLLHIGLVREIPEAMKPRAIPIASSSKVLEVQPTKLAA